MRPTAPRPILGMANELSSHRVFVHVNEFLPYFLFAPDVKVVEASLPKRSSFSCRGLKRKAQLPAWGPYFFRAGGARLFVSRPAELSRDPRSVVPQGAGAHARA